MKRPFYKSMTLWLGLPGFLFLVWAWWDGQGHLNDLDYHKGTFELDFCSDRRGGAVLVRTNTAALEDLSTERTDPLWVGRRSGVAAALRNFGAGYEHNNELTFLPIGKLDQIEREARSKDFNPNEATYRLIPRGIHWDADVEDDEPYSLMLSYPQILGLYGVAWAGVFAWRMRRRRKAVVLPE